MRRHCIELWIVISLCPTVAVGQTLDRERAVVAEFAIPHGDLPRDHETHASTITEANDGTLVAAWFGGTDENHPDVKIWVSRKTAADRSWREPVVVDNGVREVQGVPTEFSCWNPVLFTHPSGTIYLYYKISGTGPLPGYKNWWGAVRTSTDNGLTWSERVWLPTTSTDGDKEVFKPYDGRLAGPIKNRPVMLPDGRLLCGSSTESPVGWRVHFELYAPNDWTGEKQGATVIGPLLGKSGIQPTFLVHSPDYRRLQVLTREDGTASSEDGGQSWTPISDSPIDTSKGLHAVTTRSGWHFVAFNPTGRTPLSLARSRDGQKWQTVLSELNVNGDQQMDYPTILQSRDGRLHVVHSYGRDHIHHIVLDTEYLQE